MNIDIGSCFNYGFEKFKQNPAFYIGGFVVIAIVACIVYGISYAINLALISVLNNMELNRIISFLVLQGLNFVIGTVLGIALIPFFTGYYNGVKKEYEGGKAEISDVFSAFNILVPSVLNATVANIIITLGGYCCIIPGILLAPLSGLVYFFLVKGEIQGLNALKRAWETLKSAPILILWNLVLGIFGILGILLCCVGILATGPIAMCAMYKLFQQAIGEDSAPTEPIKETPGAN